jgi:2-C-methyl-D-erythritol 4-phosphate cytidylyltransferase/2-C-methyl-D-erythritol 2,4-cyclodiphosphate synthase
LTSHPDNAAIIVAAGRGTRAGGEMPKQYRLLAGETVLARSLSAYIGHARIQAVQPVIHPDDAAFYAAIAAGLASEKLLPPVHGGESRQQSVLAGLEALRHRAPKTVLIHDAARPLVTPDIIARALDALDSAPACLAAMPLADTLKAEADTKGRTGAYVAHTQDRRGLWRAQTPQGFHFAAILDAHRAAAAAPAAGPFTDDATIAEWRGLPVALVPGSERNIKLTTAEDFEMAERLLADRPALPRETRHGTGFDVHAFQPGDHVMLCGVRVPHGAALKGHSDADVGLHALTDALLGAIGAGDIGDHFPPSDMRWRGAESGQFLRHAASLVAERGGRIVHLDVTLICEAPKIGPHKPAMRARIAALLGLDAARVSVKATTTESLGFTGRREGIAAMASATVDLPIHPPEGTPDA